MALSQGHAQAAEIAWEPARNIAGAADVSLEGTYLGSWAPYNAGANTLPVNGVRFQGYNDIGITATGFWGGGPFFGAHATTDANYNRLLEYAIFGGASARLTLTGLTPGQVYLVQLWASDTRAITSWRGQSMNNWASYMNYPANGGGMGQHVIGRFTADATQQIINLSAWDSGNSANASAQINLLQVRQLARLAAGRQFFVDNAGNDANPGTRAQPWRTLAKVSAFNLEPGDTVQLTGGQTFTGPLLLTALHAGTATAKVTITSSGSARAIIAGGNGRGIELNAASNVVLDNLVVTGSGRLSGNTAHGVRLYRSDFTEARRLDISGFQHAGLEIAESSNVRALYIDAQNNGFAGISVLGLWPSTRSRNIYIGYSRAINNPGDPSITTNHSGNGIVAGMADNVTIEYCYAYNNGWDMPWTGNGPVGIWIWNSDSSVIQHSISRENKTRAGASDGGGFDFDGGTSNSVLQYSVSYGNQGSGIGLYQFTGAAPWRNNVIRYNVSENDGALHGGAISTWAQSGQTMSQAYIHNNVFYNTLVSPIDYYTQSHTGFYFTNNIIVSAGDAVKGTINPALEQYRGNLWWRVGGGFDVDGYTSFTTWANATGNEKINGVIIGQNADPRFASAGGTTITDPTQIPAYLKYRLLAGSPAIDRGLDVAALLGVAPGSRDLYGNAAPVGAARDIGVHEYGSTTIAAASRTMTTLSHDANRASGVLTVQGERIQMAADALPASGEVSVQVVDAKGLVHFNQRIAVEALRDGWRVEPSSRDGLSAGAVLVRVGEVVHSSPIRFSR